MHFTIEPASWRDNAPLVYSEESSGLPGCCIDTLSTTINGHLHGLDPAYWDIVEAPKPVIDAVTSIHPACPVLHAEKGIIVPFLYTCEG